MSRVRCPYCTGTEGRCSSSGSGRFITECVSCGRVVEERRTEVEELFVERARDSPLCIVTPDFSDNQWKRPPPMEDDPFESIGFITAFSTWSLEFSPLFTSTTTTFCGHLAELERVLLDSAYPPAGGGANSDGASNNSLSLVDNLRAYLQIVDVSSILGLDRDISDHAIQLFRDCSCTTYLRNRNIEALATAALVQAIREAQEPRTLQEISAAANVQQKEIGKYIKILGDALKLSQPINSNSISVHMPRFCSLLQLSKTTQDLATHIGEVVINKSFCTRRNPISISAAAIYLSCQLEDKRKTQAEICKVTGLTEVTLRKVYKELLENWYDLLPTNYTPAVPPERAFPMTAAALGRASATRTDVNGGVLNVSSVLDSSVPMTSGFSGVTGIPDGSHGVGSGPCNSSALQSFAQASGSATSVNVIPTSHFTTSTSSSDGKGVGNMFAARSCTQLGNIDSDKRMGKHPEESDKDIKQDTEKEIEGIDSGINSLGNLNFTTQSSTGISNFRPSCFPFEASIDPRIFQEMNPVIWPSQLLYGMPAFRPEENKGGQPSNRKNEDAWHATTKGYSFFGGLPNSGEIAMNIVPFNSSPQFDFHQTTGNAQNSVSEKDQKNEIQRDRGKVNSKEVDSEREGGGTGGQYFPQLLRGSPAVPFNAFVAAASGVSSSGAEDFPPNIWSFLKPSGLGPLGILPHQMPSSYGTLLQGLPQPVQMHIGTEKGSLPIHGDKPSSGIDATAGVGEALSGLSYANIATGMPLGHTKGSQPTSSQPMHSVWTYPFHQSLLPALNAGSHAYGVRNDGSVTLRRDVLEGNVVSNTAHPRHSGEVTGSLSWPSSDGQGTNGGLNSSFSEDRTMG